MPDGHFIFCLDPKNETKKVKAVKEKLLFSSYLISAAELSPRNLLRSFPVLLIKYFDFNSPSFKAC